jgi:hypothetical protein
MLIIALSILAALFVAAAVIDFRARRRKVRYRVDGAATLDARRLNQAEGNVRSDGTLRNGGFDGGGLGGF